MGAGHQKVPPKTDSELKFRLKCGIMTTFGLVHAPKELCWAFQAIFLSFPEESNKQAALLSWSFCVYRPATFTLGIGLVSYRRYASTLGIAVPSLPKVRV